MFVLMIGLKGDSKYKIIESHEGQEISRSLEKEDELFDTHILVSESPFSVSVNEVMFHAVETDVDMEYV